MRELLLIEEESGPTEGVIVKRMGLIALAAGAAALSSALVLAPISAKANSLISSSPASGAVLASAPNAVSVTGASPLNDQGTTLSVTDPTGAQVDDGSLTINDTTAVVGVKPLTQAGVYTVSYTLVSDTDIPLTGSYTFLFNAPATISSPTPTVKPTASTPASTTINHTADIFVIVLMVFALLVGIFLIWYARMIVKENQAKRRRTRAKKSTRPTKLEKE